MEGSDRFSCCVRARMSTKVMLLMRRASFRMWRATSSSTKPGSNQPTFSQPLRSRERSPATAFSSSASAAMNGFRRKRDSKPKNSIEPLSDDEINRLLDVLGAENSLDKLKELDRDFQFAIAKKQHEKQLLVAMREATAGEGVGFDSIIEGEYRSTRTRTS